MALGFARAGASPAWRFENAALDSLNRVDPMAIHVMDEEGFDIRGNAGRPLSPWTVEAADLIVLLAGHDEWTGPIPAPEKTVGWVVDDPLGWPRDIYEDVRDEIRCKVEELLEWLAREDQELNEVMTAANFPLPVTI